MPISSDYPVPRIAGAFYLTVSCDGRRRRAINWRFLLILRLFIRKASECEEKQMSLGSEK